MDYANRKAPILLVIARGQGAGAASVVLPSGARMTS